MIVYAVHIELKRESVHGNSVPKQIVILLARNWLASCLEFLCNEN